MKWIDVDAYCAWCYADTEFGIYYVTWSLGESGQKLRFPDGSTKQFDGDGYNDRKKAKAAAQIDYEKRKMANIITKETK